MRVFENDLNGVVIVNKPAGKTSHDMVSFIRKLFRMRRVGHTGTLDPDATGVLPICLGICTKASQYIMDSHKKYVASIQLGSATTTQDATGEVTTGAPFDDISKEMLLETVNGFIGEINQVPPMYSAVKVGGKKLYELAREGIEVPRKARTVQIFDLSVLDVDMRAGTARMEVECSKGTYIRTLINDIGEKLGCFAHMTALERIESGGFALTDAYSCEQLINMEKAGTLEMALIPTEKVFSKYPEVHLNEKDTWRVRNGIPVEHRFAIAEQLYRVYGDKDEFLCVSVGLEDGRLKMVTSFWSD